MKVVALPGRPSFVAVGFTLSLLCVGVSCFSPSSFSNDGGASDAGSAGGATLRRGGASGSGGGSATGGHAGGTAATGGGPAATGGTGTGGAGSGGLPATTGGRGGAGSDGGQPPASGGATATGGRIGSGGAASGGAVGSGGSASGGRAAGGGMVGTGGAPGSGGAATGGAGTGGRVCEAGRPPSAIPVAVFDATPAGGCGATCNLASALTTDGTAAGLDCDDPSSAVLIDSVYVTACVGADFGAVVNLDPLTIRARGVANACGRACSEEYCNTGDTMVVFYGTARGVYQWAREILITRTFADYSLGINVAARYVVVCRGGAGAHRDDVQVDSIRTENACM